MLVVWVYVYIYKTAIGIFAQLEFFLRLIISVNLMRKTISFDISGLSKELQEHKTEPVYHMVPDRRLYGNMQTDHDLPLAAPAQASRIRFVNSLGSRSESLNDTLDGRVNPAFHSDTSLRVSSYNFCQRSLFPF